MPSFEQLCQKVDNLRGKVDPQERCTDFVFPRLKARQRVENEKGRTRLIKQLDTPETYSEFEFQFSRYKQHAGNVQLAYQIMLDLLKALPDEGIERLAKS